MLTRRLNVTREGIEGVMCHEAADNGVDRGEIAGCLEGEFFDEVGVQLIGVKYCGTA